MLSLFKDDIKLPLNATPPLDWARIIWRKTLDQGHCPNEKIIQQEWIKEHTSETEFPDEINLWCNQLGESCWLDSMLSDPSVREIFAHSPELIEAVGKKRELAEFPLGADDWSLWVETLAIKIRAEFNYTKPCSSTHWDHQGTPWRVTLLHSSLAPGTFPKVFFRRLAAIPYPLSEYGLDANGIELLKSSVLNQENLLVAGSTGSGKTSCLSTLLEEASSEEHLVLLEDTQEISCNAKRLTRLLSNENQGRSLSDLLAHTLRLSPDRIVLGEMRSHEVVPFLLAMNTGHKGVMGTLHASSAVDALHRVAQLFSLASGRKEMDYKEVLKLVSKNVGIVIFLEKRKIKQMIRVYGCEEGQPLYDVIWE